MIYSNKKVQKVVNHSAQMAKIIANVKTLKEKNLLRIEAHEVFVYPEIWKDEAIALNWIKCLHLYCTTKYRIKETETLNFKHFITGELIGTVKNKRASVLFFTS